MRHPTKVGKCLRCGAKGHSVAECWRPRRDTANRDNPNRAAGRGRGRGGKDKGRGRGQGGGKPQGLNN
eukprot:3390751-Amphidinium_carterae.1